MKTLPWVLVVVLSLALLVTWCTARDNRYEKGEVEDTIWLPVHIDTIRDTVIVPPVSEKPVGMDSARLPVLRPKSPKPQTDNSDSLTSDSVDVLVPITEKEYRSPDYRIVVSGYKPKLEEVELYRRTDVGIVKPPRQKRKRWGIGPCVSWGISPTGKPQFVLGVSVQYSLLQW